jgi:hypothetical protein
MVRLRNRIYRTKSSARAKKVARGTTDSLALCQQRVPTAHCIRVSPSATTLPCAARSVSLLLCLEVFPVMVTLNRLSVRGMFVRAKQYLTGTSEFYNTSCVEWRRRMESAGFRLPAGGAHAQHDEECHPRSGKEPEDKHSSTQVPFRDTECRNRWGPFAKITVRSGPRSPGRHGMCWN